MLGTSILTIVAILPLLKQTVLDETKLLTCYLLIKRSSGLQLILYQTYLLIIILLVWDLQTVETIADLLQFTVRAGLETVLVLTGLFVELTQWIVCE